MPKKTNKPPKKNINWHRLFGLTLTDFFTGSCYEVEIEKNLTFQELYLDLVIIRKSGGNLPQSLPDGLDNLSEHNLLTYKSSQEPLERWTIDELIGYYMIYRKMVSPSTDDLLQKEQFQLYAVTTRKPHWLMRYENKKEISEGIYEIECYTRPIRVIITSQLPESDANAVLQLFSGNAKGFHFGETHYQWRKPKSKGLLRQMFELYFKEKIIMSYTMEDFERDYTRDHLYLLSKKEVLGQYSPKEVLEQYSPKEVLGQYSPDEVFQQFSPEVALQQVLKQFPPEVIEESLAKLKKS